MPKIVVRTTDEGLRIPADVLEQAGVEPGGLIELEFAVLPGPREIQKEALRHTIWHLGDAIRVGRPQWQAGEWVVDLWSVDRQERIGQLYLDAHGQVIQEKSTTRETLG
ncbi:MAG: hypothetical protein HY320_09215 [Armatimonadetes bacterium]|nr:hypothetical protein [Armatimonadota bacterium]